MIDTKYNFPKKQFRQISGVTFASILIMACAPAPATQEQISMVDQNVNVSTALEIYSQAWASRDTDAIIERHADDTQFHVVTLGSEPAIGKAEIRAAFNAIFESNPNYQSSVRSVKLGSDFAVVEYDIQMDPNRPGQIGLTVFTPSGQAYKMPAVDIIVFENGLVTRKVTYLDTETIRANSSKVEQVSK